MTRTTLHKRPNIYHPFCWVKKCVYMIYSTSPRVSPLQSVSSATALKVLATTQAAECLLAHIIRPLPHMHPGSSYTHISSVKISFIHMLLLHKTKQSVNQRENSFMDRSSLTRPLFWKVVQHRLSCYLQDSKSLTASLSNVGKKNHFGGKSQVGCCSMVVLKTSGAFS